MRIEVKISKKRVNYIKAMRLLENRVEDVFNGKKPELLWILEHNSIYTGGTSFKNKDILNKKIKVIKSSRGGKITYHGPGQKVVYFVLNLKKRKKDIRLLITKIENCIIRILDNYNIESFSDRKNIGIWIKNKDQIKKVAAIGIKVKKWIAYHGFSINISTNLNFYKHIIPCGIKDRKLANIKSINDNNYQNIDKIIKNNFMKFFN